VITQLQPEFWYFTGLIGNHHPHVFLSKNSGTGQQNHYENYYSQVFSILAV